MNTNRQTLRFFVLAAVLIVILPTIVLAHGDQHHVMGTVTKIDGSSMSVKTTTGEIKVVMILSTTKFLKGTAAITQQDVRLGDRVVIHAKPEGNTLHATEVKVGEATASSPHN